MTDLADDMLACPRCGYELEVSALIRQRVETDLRDSLGRELEAVAARRLAQKDRELDAAKRQLAEAAGKEAALLARQRELAEREQQLHLESERKLASEIARIREHEAAAANERAAREADERVREETARIREHERKRLDERMQAERDERELREQEQVQHAATLQRTVDELQRKLALTAQQLHGEAQEVALRDLLVDAFPCDEIEDVARGVRGADVVQHVRGPDGQACDTIIWESKRTRAWSDGWLAKLRDDQRDTRATLAVIVTQVMPRGVRQFGLVDGVWVCAWPYAAALARVLRETMIDLARARRAAEGRGEKMHKLYDYLTGPELKNRITGLLEAIADMRDDLERERAAMTARWKKREKQLARALDNIAAFHGDLQGIAGNRLIELPLLELDDVASPEAHEDGDSVLP